jgi:hypothetical protein
MGTIEELKVQDEKAEAEKAAFEAHVAESAQGIRELVACEISDKRLESLVVALDLGADAATLRKLAQAGRLARKATIVLPPGRFEGLSRGRGWARLGKGRDVTWGERVDGGYRVGPGHWTVGSNDGFSRKQETVWDVEHVRVGGETWTVAS